MDPKLADDFSLTLEEILERSPDFQKFHPTNIMETGYDILFFWVARMMLMTLGCGGQEYRLKPSICMDLSVHVTVRKCQNLTKM